MAQDLLSPLKLVLIGGSAGSLEVLLKIIAALNFPGKFSIIIIVHRKNTPETILSDLIATKTNWPVKEVEDKERLVAGTIYLGPPDYHLLFEDKNTFSLDGSEKINYSRPSIDVSFQSAAEIFGAAVIAILLSGANADGSVGIKTIADHGGYTIVQDPASADVSYMPESAIKIARINEILTADEIGMRVAELLAQ